MSMIVHDFCMSLLRFKFWLQELPPKELAHDLGLGDPNEPAIQSHLCYLQGTHRRLNTYISYDLIIYLRI